MPRKKHDRWAQLPEQWQEELSDEALTDCGGETVFARGQAYFAQGKALLVRDGGGNTTWEVRGSQLYRVELYFEDLGLHVDCDCPYAADQGFCKHMVAAGLAWRAHLDGTPDSEENQAPARTGRTQAAIKSGAAAAKRAATTAAKYESLRGFVQSRSAAELSQRLWAWAEQDRDLMADLRAWQAQAEAASRPDGWKDAVAELLKKTRDFYDWGESRRYAQRADKVLPLLRGLVATSPVVALDACAGALARVFKVCEHADDSGGHIGGLMHAIHDVLLDALRAAPPEGKAAERWLALWLDLQSRDPWGLWSDEAMLQVAGPAVAGRYSERVAGDWADWLRRRRPPAAPSLKVAAAWSSADSFEPVRHGLRSRYLGDLRRRGDSAGVLELLRSDLASASEFLELAQQLEAMGREREALQQLEAADKKCPGDWPVEEALLRAYERDGCVEEALTVRRRQLERRPDVQGYVATLAAAKAAGRDAQAYRAELHQWAGQAESQSPMLRWSNVTYSAGAAPGSGATRDVTIRLRWLTHDRRFDEALELTRASGSVAAEGAWLDLAHAMSKTHRTQAAEILERALLAHMRRAQTPYREALALVNSWLVLLPAAQARERLAWLKAQYRAKRNFVAGLGAVKLG